MSVNCVNVFLFYYQIVFGSKQPNCVSSHLFFFTHIAIVNREKSFALRFAKCWTVAAFPTTSNNRIERIRCEDFYLFLQYLRWKYNFNCILKPYTADTLILWFLWQIALHWRSHFINVFIHINMYSTYECHHSTFTNGFLLVDITAVTSFCLNASRRTETFLL